MPNPKDPAAVALGRKRWTATGDDPRQVGKLGAKHGGKGGRPGIPTPCQRCGVEQPSKRAAKEHCR